MEKEILADYKSYGYPSVKKLYRILEGKYKTDEIKKVIEKEPVYQLYYNKKKEVGHIMASHVGEEWFADLCFMDKFGGVNKGYHYILLVVDAYSRYCFAEPLKTKNISEVVIAFKKILDKGKKPALLCSDNGSEFVGRAFKDLLDEEGIVSQFVDVGDHHALGIIDRLTRTLKNIMYKNFIYNNNNVWIDKLEEIVEKYNNTPNEGILGFKPVDVYEEKEGVQVLLNTYNFERGSGKKENKFKEGDEVRVRLPDDKFKRGFHPKWSSDLEKVDKVNGRKVYINGKKYKVVNVIKGSGNVGGELKKGLKEARVTRRLNKEGIKGNFEIFDGNKYVGTKIRKKFGNKYYNGIITKYKQSRGDPTKNSDWYVEYEDGDHETFDLAEIKKYRI
jgi:transposase InsO family protein